LDFPDFFVATVDTPFLPFAGLGAGFATLTDRVADLGIGNPLFVTVIQRRINARKFRDYQANNLGWDTEARRNTRGEDDPILPAFAGRIRWNHRRSIASLAPPQIAP
jgi:hypothetical protein